MQALRVIRHWVTNALFPQFCISCSEEGEILCRACRAKWRPRVQVTENSFAFFEESDKVARGLVKAWKYGFSQEAWLVIKESMREQKEEVVTWLQKKGIHELVPIPLFYTKKSQRGFDQAEVIVESITEIADTNINKAIYRKEFTKPQARKKKKERLNSYKDNVFGVKRGGIENCAIVDDIRTTGSTIAAVSKCIERADGQVKGSITLIHIL